MSWVFLNDELTHTGTETTLSGLDGVTGAIAWVDGIKKCYRIDDTIVDKLILDGELTLDSD